MRVALDTNVLAYAEGVGDERRCSVAMKWVEQLPSVDVVLPAQTLGELSRVLMGKAKRSAEQTRAAVLNWADSFEVADSTEGIRNFVCGAYDVNKEHVCQPAGRPQRRPRLQRRDCRPSPRNSLTSLSAVR